VRLCSKGDLDRVEVAAKEDFLDRDLVYVSESFLS
jgi:hypothetical protein